ncbi:MAG: DUF1828 domain-containing protein [Armatimonadia bacterium]
MLTPFRFTDGDHLSILLIVSDGRWLLTDEGHTYLHLTYELDEADFTRGTRQQIISNALTAFEVHEVDGQLVRPVDDGEFGNALYAFIQALLRITDVTFLSRERARSTFLQDLKGFITDIVPEDRLTVDWHDPVLDPEQQYVADYRINSLERPLMIYALPSDDRTRDATISLLRYDSWGLKVRSLGIFEDQEGINRKVLARFTDVADRQFSSLPANKSRIEAYLCGLIDA